MTSLLLLTKLAAASSVIYLSFRWWRHHPRQQKRAITRSFAAETEIHIDTSVPQLIRTAEANFLKRWFDSPPTGPIVLAGPVGAGRSYLIKSVLSDRKMTIYVDFRREPVVTGEEHIAGIVAAAGYVIPQATEIMRMFTREEQRKTKITPQEADRALACILEALQDCKQKRWVDGIPLICLDDVSILGVKGAQGPELDMFWMKFLDWCAYVSDAKLAHVVFVPSESFEPHSPVYDHPVFRTKRILLFVDYPSTERVRKYVRAFVNEQCPNLDSVPNLGHMVDWIVNCIGGKMDDLMQLLGALRRGDKYGAVLRRMITDAVSTVEERLEQVLAEAHHNKDKEEVYKKYLRLWAAMEMLRDHEVVNRRDIVRHIFKEHTTELKQYVEWGLMSYANQKAEIDDGDGDSVKVAANSGSNEGIALSSLQSPSAPPVSASPLSMDPKTAVAAYPAWWTSERVPSKTPSPSSSSDGAATPAPERRTHSTLLNASLESMLVAAGSPRVRIAFDLLLKDERLADRKEAMTIHLEVKSLQDKLEKIEVTRKQRFDQLQVVLAETDRFLANINAWKEVYGLEFTESRKSRLMKQENDIHQTLDSLQQDSERLQSQKVNLEARAKQLTTRL